MQLTNLFDENDGSRAVSPVIGVILMVAITVILAAVIGTFVLGLGENVNSTPQVSFDFETNETTTGTIDQITITHNGGDSIDVNRLNVTGGVADIEGSNDKPIAFTDDDISDFTSGDTLSAGDQLLIDSSTTNISINGEEGDVVRIVYKTEGGGSSSVIGTFELPADGAGSI